MRQKEERRSGLGRLLQSIGEGLRRLIGRFFGGATAPGGAAAIRARYDEIVREESTRIARYKQAVA